MLNQHIKSWYMVISNHSPLIDSKATQTLVGTNEPYQDHLSRWFISNKPVWEPEGNDLFVLDRTNWTELSYKYENDLSEWCDQPWGTRMKFICFSSNFVWIIFSSLAAGHLRHPTLQTSDIWNQTLQNISNNNLIRVLKSPVPSTQGGGPVSTCMRCATALVFSIILPTGTPSLLSQFPAIVLPTATSHRLLPGSGKRWDVKAGPISPSISFDLSRWRRGAFQSVCTWIDRQHPYEEQLLSETKLSACSFCFVEGISPAWSHLKGSLKAAKLVYSNKKVKSTQILLLYKLCWPIASCVELWWKREPNRSYHRVHGTTPAVSYLLLQFLRPLCHHLSHQVAFGPQ